MNKAKRTGFSLIEILIAMGLLATVFTVVGSVLLTTLRNSRKAAAVAAARSEGAYAMGAIVNNIRYAKAVTCPGGDAVAVELADGRTLTYSRETSSLPVRILLSDGTTQTGLTSDKVNITVGAGCINVFSCPTSTSVAVCFAIDNAEGLDVSDQAANGGLQFKSGVTLVNLAN